VAEDECEQCRSGTGCRLRLGSCKWSSTPECRRELTQLRTADLDVWTVFNELIKQSKGRGLRGFHSYPMRKLRSNHRIGELKATGDGGEQYRLYYGEPDEPDDVAVALHVALKRIFPGQRSITWGQDRAIRTARDRFMRWLKVNRSTSTR
jgi:hypothetical protein